ncbi:hypothetical protein [Paraburkholderia aromaticivorans]|uniref:Uncharacterized protein n=1 Tax=Paraburkholderia aromaticivorans TaxID=2026199 RepID=A0A248VYE1_9BURK|nr:hypothetical protein [Paraburkholderia aromaticivorans]ASW04066.1 hypothetical protein CJU94_38740 [Paraburkholderia aromaticivorans]
MFDVVFGLEELEDLLRKHGCADVVDIDSGMKLEVHDVHGRMTVFSPGAISSISATAATVISMASKGKFVQRTGRPIPLRSNIDIERVDQVVVVIDRDEGGAASQTTFSPWWIIFCATGTSARTTRSCTATV